MFTCCEIYCQLCLACGLCFYTILCIMSMNGNYVFLEHKANGIENQHETYILTLYNAIVSIITP